MAGEISGSKTATSGHCYFTLKDQNAQLRCVCFRQSLRYLKFKPQDGITKRAGSISSWWRPSNRKATALFNSPMNN